MLSYFFAVGVASILIYIFRRREREIVPRKRASTLDKIMQTDPVLVLPISPDMDEDSVSDLSVSDMLIERFFDPELSKCGEG